MKKTFGQKLVTWLIPWALTLLFAEHAAAEGRLIGGTPRDNEVVARFDGTLKLWFTGNIGEKSPSLVILDKAGQRVDRKDTRITPGERTELMASTINPLPAGPYIAHYRVITEDGLVISGIYRFSIKATEAQGGTP